MLGFEELKGSHSGVNLAAKTLEVLDRYNVRGKVGIFINLCFHAEIFLMATADNASANDKALHVIETEFDPFKKKWVARQCRVRYDLNYCPGVRTD